MQLNFKKVGAGQPLIILHGLFGSLDNWMTLSKKLGESYEIFIVDARNHGFSPHSDDFNYDVMVEDLYQFIEEHELQSPIILGHSMGGKTAMQLTTNYPHLVSKLIVADIAPKSYPVHHTAIIDGMSALNFDIINSRKGADLELSKHITDLSTRQFILKNLYWKEKGILDWKFNLTAIKNNISNIGVELTSKNTYEKPTLFIRGTKSNYILKSDYSEIKTLFPHATIESIESGHWVHAEDPATFLKLVTEFLESE